VLYIEGAQEMRVFKTKVFARFARRQGLDDESLCEAVNRAVRGLIDADLGGGLIKQRIPRRGRGRSGGFRAVIVWRRKDRGVFVHGFAKNERENIDDADLADLKELAALLLSYGGRQLDEAVTAGELMEVSCGGQED
jgi:hypothetical protein